MKFGIKPEDFNFLDEHLIKPLKQRGARVFLFGSRATGRSHPFSDVDLLFVESPDQPISPSLIAQLLSFFEESEFPYKIDLVNDCRLATGYRPSVEANMIEI